jgi:hypothetical protein
MFSGNRPFPWLAAIAEFCLAVGIAAGTINLGQAQAPVPNEKTNTAEQQNPSAEDAAATAAGEKAMARLQELGASVYRGIQPDGSQITVYFGNGWKGNGADLDLLNDLAALGEMSLMVDFRKISPRSFAELKLRKPLATLDLEAAPDELFDHLAALPPIKKLVFAQWHLTPVGCRRFVKAAPDVKSLTIKRYTFDSIEQKVSTFTDAVTAEFGGLESLKALTIESAAITGAGLKHLSGMKHLERLVLDVCPGLAKTDLAALADLDALRSLELYFPLSAGSLATLGKLSSLETLKFEISILELRDDTPVDPDDLRPADFEPLAAMAGLQDLQVGTFMASSEGTRSNVAPVNLGDAIARAAGRMPSLRTFKLFCLGNNHEIDHKSLTALARSATLEDLHVGVAQLDDQSLELVSGVASLRKLTLGPPSPAGKISDRGLAHLKKATGLVALSLPVSKEVTDAGLAQLAGLTALEELTLSDSAITGTGLAALRPLTKLTGLSLRSWYPHLRPAFRDDGCRLLPEVLPQLRRLDLYGTEITDAGLVALAGLSNLVSLDVSNNPALTDAGLTDFEHHKNLRAINIQQTRISEQALAKLRATLRKTDSRAIPPAR